MIVSSKEEQMRERNKTNSTNRLVSKQMKNRRRMTDFKFLQPTSSKLVKISSLKDLSKKIKSNMKEMIEKQSNDEEQ